MERNPEVNLPCLLNNLANAKDDNEVFRILTELNIIFEFRGHNLKKQFSEVDLSPFMKQLSVLTGKSKECGIGLLRKVLDHLTPFTSAFSYRDVIVEGLRSEDESIKLSYLNCLKDASVKEEEVEFMLKDLHNIDPVLQCVAECLSDESISVAKQAANVIENVSGICKSIDEIMTERYVGVFIKQLGTMGSVIRFRVYELFVKIFLSKTESLQNKNVTSIFEKLINEMNTNDVLSQLNCLDLLSQIACGPPVGLQFITEKGTLENVSNIFKSVESDPFKELLIPGAIKFFGNIAITNPLDILPNYGLFVEFIFSCMSSEDPMLVVIAFETIANICTSDDGLRLLCDNSDQLCSAMKIAGQFIQSSIDEAVKTRLLAALSVLFRPRKPEIGHQTSARKEKLYRNIIQNPLLLLMSAAKQPFPAVRCNSLRVLSNLAVYSWIQQDIALTPGFLEYLLDRRTEPEKQGKELKYSILKTLIQPTTAKDYVGVEYHKRICQYVKDGPFYSAQETAVDFEEAS